MRRFVHSRCASWAIFYDGHMVHKNRQAGVDREWTAETSLPQRCREILQGMGGCDNVVDLEPCALRIRVQVRDQDSIDEHLLRQPPVIAVVRSGDGVPLVTGIDAERVMGELRQLCS